MPAGVTETIVAWKSKGLPNKEIKLPTTASNSLSQKLKQHDLKARQSNI